MSDSEIETIKRIYNELAAMDEAGRLRVIRYLTERFLSSTKAARGSAGGHARAAKLSASERSAMASKAATARWKDGEQQ